jgi:hypothetical protein
MQQDRKFMLLKLAGGSYKRYGSGFPRIGLTGYRSTSALYVLMPLKIACATSCCPLAEFK